MNRRQSTKPFDDTEKTTLRILNSHMNNYLRLYGKLEALGPHVPDPDDIKRSFPILSRRESQIVHQTCLGFSATLIAKRGGVSRRTVESQLLSAYQKLSVNTKKDLIDTIVDSAPGNGKNRLLPHRRLLFSRNGLI
jgi:DNA-binding CsgD family transcriptional regulator